MLHPEDDFVPAKSLLTYKGIKNPFEEYLKDKHADNYHGTDDDMPDDFDDWIGNMDQDTLISYGDEFARKLLVTKNND